MKFLVLGCGSIGRRHIGNLQTLGVEDLTAVDILPEPRQRVEKDFGITTFTSLSEGLSANPDVVFVTTPTSLHIEVALQAARTGCHLFVEKPLSHNLDGVDELLSVAKSNNLIALVACNMRFDPGLGKVKELLNDGAVGTLVSARAQVGQWLPDWHPDEDYRHSYSANQRLGGGIILDAIHEIDYVGWLVNRPVEKVSCFAGQLTQLEIDTEDTAAILLLFTGGVIGEIHMDYVQRAYSRSCQLVGEKGTICWDETANKVSWYSASVGNWQEWSYSSSWEPNQMYQDELRHYLRCLSGEEKPVQDLSAAKVVLETALAAKRSAQTFQVIENPVR